MSAGVCAIAPGAHGSRAIHSSNKITALVGMCILYILPTEIIGPQSKDTITYPKPRFTGRNA